MKKIIVSLAFASLLGVALPVAAGPINVDISSPDGGASGSGNPAAADTGNPDAGRANNAKESNFQLVSCNPTLNTTTGQLEKDCNYEQLLITIGRLVRFVLYLLTPIVLGMILYTGWKFLTSGGDEHKLEDAKRMIKPLVLGVFFMLAAYLIVYKFILQNLLAPQIGDITKTEIINSGGN